ncbi:MAG: hypothetical protein WCO54_09240 [Bacteroidota bacterium]
MKKILVVSLFAFALASCHYGQADAKKTLETNEQYKGDKSDYSTNRGNDGVMPEKAQAEKPATDTTSKAK